MQLQQRDSPNTRQSGGGRMKTTRDEAIKQAKNLMALKPKERFKLPEIYSYTDAVGSEECKVTISYIRKTTQTFEPKP